MRFHRMKTAALALSLTAGLTATAAPAIAAPTGGPTTSARCGQACNVLFDDFDYRSSDDPKLAKNGWVIRTAPGGPGDEGASWLRSNVTFPTADGRRALRLTAKTDGTPAGTSEAEISRTDEESLAGTYLARIKFSDAPVSGPDGDPVVQTFFAISSTPDCDPTYSETDFSEYLPNGGYGDPRTLNSQTTWALTGADCSDSVGDIQARSFAGWHDVMGTVGNGHVKYYVDGKLVADHGGKYYPRHAMAIDFNQWFVDLAEHTGSSTSTWHQDVDYVLYAKDQVLTPARARLDVAVLRALGVSYVNRLSAR